MDSIENVAQRFARALQIDVKNINLQRVRLIADAMHVKQNDPFLQVIMLLDYYYGLYDIMPGKIRKEARDVKIDLTRQLVNDVHFEAKTAAVKTLTQWIIGAVVICTVSIAAFGFLMFQFGERSVERGQRIEYIQPEQPKIELPAPRRVN